MPRRHNYEPINLIHRIPTPEQLDAARTVGPSFSQTLGRVLARAGEVCWRKTIDLLKYMARYEEQVTKAVRGPRALPPPRHYVEHVEDTPFQQEAPGHRLNGGMGEPRIRTTVILPREEQPRPVEYAEGTVEARPEEVSALKSYISGQQQDIASLTAQIRELKSLVASQQQVLVHLGEELETGSFPALSSRSASAAPRRDRVGRDKSIPNDSSIPHAETDGRSLNL